jgi:hypothetical protein
VGAGERPSERVLLQSAGAVNAPDQPPAAVEPPILVSAVARRERPNQGVLSLVGGVRATSSPSAWKRTARQPIIRGYGISPSFGEATLFDSSKTRRALSLAPKLDGTPGFPQGPRSARY